MKLAKRIEIWNKAEQLFKHEIINTSFVKSGMMDAKFFKELEELVFKSIDKSYYGQTGKMLPRDWADSLPILEKINPFRLKKDPDLFTQMDALIARYLKSIGAYSDFIGIEYGVNLRVVHPVPPSFYKDYKYQTDLIHSDVWSGEPSDMVNFFLYLAGDMNTYLDLYHTSEADLDLSANAVNGFEQVPNIKMTKIDYTPVPGQQIFFDGAVPHHTTRKGQLPRLSMDFRLRRRDPYDFEPHQWNDTNQSWGRYWYLQDGDALTPKERLDFEIELMKKNGHGQNKIELRLQQYNKWIETAS